MALAVVLAGCDNPTNNTPQSHPDNIGYINVGGRNIDIRATFAMTADQKTDLLERLEYALSQEWIQGRLSQLRIIEVTGFAPDHALTPVAGGILRGVVPSSGDLDGAIWFGIGDDGFPVVYNSATNTIHPAGAASGNQRG